MNETPTDIKCYPKVHEIKKIKIDDIYLHVILHVCMQNTRPVSNVHSFLGCYQLKTLKKNKTRLQYSKLVYQKTNTNKWNKSDNDLKNENIKLHMIYFKIVVT